MLTLAQAEIKLKKFLEEHKDEFHTNQNEAQTRFFIIDYLLFECLGWDKNFIAVEKNEENKFTDYELGKPRLAILEAKREGKTFEIPAYDNKSLTCDIRSLTKMCSSIEDTIDQAISYCNQRGVPIGIISNGHQYITFIASRQDGISIKDGKAIVFRSLEHLVDNFKDAWQIMSFHGIKEKNIYKYLKPDFESIPSKLSSKLRNYPIVRYGSELQSNLRQLAEIFFQDIVENEQVEERFFKECYCESGALSKYSLLSKNILEARYASLFSQSETAPYITPVREKKNNNISPDILSEALSRRPIVLLGDVGVGKTSFVKNLIHNGAYEEFKRAFYIYIDLGSSGALTSNLKDFILEEIEKQLLEKYNVDINDYSFIKGVYASEISRFSRGVWGQKKDSDPTLYETKLLEMIADLCEKKDVHLKRAINTRAKSENRQIIVCLDNADQRDYEVQQDTFIISQELAKDWNTTVFVSVRPQTFFKSKRSGALSAYPHKVFTISPPRIDLVIQKRLSFALEMAEGKIPLEVASYVQVNSKNLAVFLKVLIDSLATNNELKEFLTNITGGNIRNAIELIVNFIGSPNVDAQKIIELAQQNSDNKKYVVPLHEFTKSALLGDYSHYNADTSIAMNLFDVSTSDTYEHFLTPILLAFLCSNNSKQDRDSFYSLNVLQEELQNNGFTINQIHYAIRRCTNRKLIETSQRITFDEDDKGLLIGDMPDNFRITTIGAYHLKKWVGSFTYLDAMVFDTPIFNDLINESLVTHLESLSINDRLERALSFKQYLQDLWRNYPHKPEYFDLSNNFEDSVNTFERVIRAVVREETTSN